MSRLSATLRLDVALQARNKVYLIIGVAACGLAFALRALFSPEQLHFFMPLVALSGVGVTAFLLVGVLLLLERGEQTLDVVLVSPLRPAEYLASKLLTVTALALVEGAVITAVAYGLGFWVPWLVLAMLLRAGLVAAVGVAVGVRYRSITHFLLPMVGLSLAFDLPVDPVQLVYACVYGTLALGAAVFWASRALDRFVVRGELRS